MVTNLFFDVVLLLCCGYAFWRGGPPERIGAAIFIAGVLFTRVAVSGAATRYSSIEAGVLIVDVAILSALLVLALRADRLWPLWVAALQAIGAAGHAVKLANPEVIRWAYAFALAFWSYPMLFLLAFGTWNHQRRLAKFGVDKSWSSSSGRSGTPPPTGPIG
ncbi:MAG TPA: hypothetical protein VFP12_00980 [Allosphingosinicella sp.]|nr:hypothetical protein [Allosphingosinicella sp.]